MNLSYNRISIFFNFLFLTTFGSSLSASDFVKYKATFELQNFVGDEVVVAHYLGDKIYVDDTLQINKKGKFVFENDKELYAGLYLLVMPPENSMLEFIINESEAKFEMKANVMKAPFEVTFKGSKDNELFYSYFQYMKTVNPDVEVLNNELKELKEKEKDTKAVEKKLVDIRNKIGEKKKEFIKKAPKNSIAATYLRSQLDLDYPDFEGTEEEKRKQTYNYRVQNFYSKLKGDPRIHRSKMFFDMSEFYIEKLTAQEKDSVFNSVDRTLNLVSDDQSLFNTYLIRFINKYITPKRVGHDAVFVNLVDKYVIDQEVAFLKQETKDKIIDQANKTREILIGKIAPQIEVFKFDVEGTILAKDNKDEYKRFKLDGPFDLHKFESPYTVLFFWKPNCGHCTKALPKMVDFYDKYKDKGVEVISQCIKTYKEMPACAQMIKENKAIKWINVVDPFYRSQFAVKYDLTKTPKIYILDHKKEILIKNIGAEQIERVMDQILKQFEEKEDEK